MAILHWRPPEPGLGLGRHLELAGGVGEAGVGPGLGTVDGHPVRMYIYVYIDICILHIYIDIQI